MKRDALKACFVLAVIFAGLLSVALRGREAIFTIFRNAQPRDFMSGTLAGRIDRAVFDAIPRSSTLDGLAVGLLYAGLHDAGPQVWAGCGDWLFSIEELRADRHDMENILARAKILQLIERAFATREILLVVLPIPDKAEQVEDQLCGTAASQSRRRATMWAGATTARAPQIDLNKQWPRPGYWRTDTHWDNTGARFAAEAVAQTINVTLGPGSEDVSLAKGAMRERRGDLARLAGLTDAPQGLAPPLEREEGIKAAIVRSVGLLDDTLPPSIVLAGSSYSLNSGFLEYLQVMLAREVAQASQAGGGFAGALLELLQRKPSVLAGVKVVIWEWPMRSLSAPLSEAEHQFLKQPPSNP